MVIPISLCWICDKPVDLATCTIDEYREPVHQTCQIARIALDHFARKEHKHSFELARKENPHDPGTTRTVARPIRTNAA